MLSSTPRETPPEATHHLVSVDGMVIVNAVAWRRCKSVLQKAVS